MKTFRTLLVWSLVPLTGFLIMIFLVGPAFRPPPQGTHQPTEPVQNDFDQLLGRDAIRPVYDPTFVSAEEAGLRPDELVMGVEIRGEARAYPVGYLNFREMVNDRIGPVPFLVTW